VALDVWQHGKPPAPGHLSHHLPRIFDKCAIIVAKDVAKEKKEKKMKR
jgi:hypothetical protein